MGRRMEEVMQEDWRARGAPEGDASRTEGADEENGDVQERGSLEMVGVCAERSSSHYVIGERAPLALTRSHTDEEQYWGRATSKSFPQEVTSGSRGSAGERSPQGMVAGDCTWGDMRPCKVHGKEKGQVDLISEQQPSGGWDGRGNEEAKMQERMEMPVPEGANQDGQVLQKRKKKSKSSKEKKRGQANGGCKELAQGGGHQSMEESSFQDLYRGQSLEKEKVLQDIPGQGEIREDSQYELSSSSAEATDIGTSEVDLSHEINGNKGISMGIEGRGFTEGLLFSKDTDSSLGMIKGFIEEVPGSAEHHEECPQYNGSYRDVCRSPGNGCSGSSEGLQMEQGNYNSGDPSGGLGRCETEENSNPINYQHLQFVAQNCSSPAHQMASVGQSGSEGCGTVEETGTWCWCLHLYLGDSEGSPHVESDTADEGPSRECGYSMSSTLRVGEHLSERNEDGGANLGDIPEPLTKKGGKIGETPELQEWVNWWQGWAGSCRAVSGRRRGKTAQAWGCRGEARAEGQKQQDVWVLREWTRRDAGRRGENGPRVSGSEVWVLRKQEEGKEDSAWPIGKEDVWVPREPRKHRSAYFMTDDTKWTPRSAKPGVSDRSEP